MDSEVLNFRTQQAFRLARKRWLELRAALAGKRFYCASLSGESAYNLCVNSDMTVSCNCQDFDGSGHIGDLHGGSLQEALGSGRAMALRRSLAAGRLPLLTCASCADLRVCSPEEAQHHVENWHTSKDGIMVENTVACPYRCKACYRTLVRNVRRSVRMTPDDIRKVSAIVRENEIKSLSFFSLGEPFAAPDIYNQLRSIRADNPELTIKISTNGLLLNTDEKREAALLVDLVAFSIAGIDDDTMKKYQRGGSFSKVYANLKRLVEWRESSGKTTPAIEWKYILFNWNDRETMINRAIELAKEAGVDMISFWPTRHPISGISWRYYLKRSYRTMGEPRGGGRTLRFARPETEPQENVPGTAASGGAETWSTSA